MGLMQMSKFEQLNNCQVNLFHQKLIINALVYEKMAKDLIFFPWHRLLTQVFYSIVKYFLVYRFIRKNLVPIRNSNEQQESLVVDFLLLTHDAN